MFKLQGDYIVNEKGQVLDVQGGNDSEGQNIIVYNRNSKVSQKWRIVYVDEDKEEPKKGELNEDFGLYVERHFYVESALPTKRLLESHGNNLVINWPVGSATQKWYFDQRTKTIRSVAQTNKSWDIQSSGKSTNLQIWNVNSNWW